MNAARSLMPEKSASESNAFSMPSDLSASLRLNLDVNSNLGMLNVTMPYPLVSPASISSSVPEEESISSVLTPSSGSMNHIEPKFFMLTMDAV